MNTTGQIYLLAGKNVSKFAADTGIEVKRIIIYIQERYNGFTVTVTSERELSVEKL